MRGLVLAVGSGGFLSGGLGVNNTPYGWKNCLKVYVLSDTLMSLLGPFGSGNNKKMIIRQCDNSVRMV